MKDVYALLDGSSVCREGTEEEGVESDGSRADHGDYSCRVRSEVVIGRKEDGISDLHR